VKHKTKLISANKDKHMNIHGGCLKLFKYCVNELYFSFAKLLKANITFTLSICMSPTLWIFMNLMFVDFFKNLKKLKFN
jgi:hypothetical protein